MTDQLLCDSNVNYLPTISIKSIQKVNILSFFRQNLKARVVVLSPTYHDENEEVNFSNILVVRVRYPLPVSVSIP